MDGQSVTVDSTFGPSRVHWTACVERLADSGRNFGYLLSCVDPKFGNRISAAKEGPTPRQLAFFDHL